MTYDELRLRAVGALDQYKAAQESESDALYALYIARGTKEAPGLELSYTSAKSHTESCLETFNAAYDAMKVVEVS